MLEKPPIPDENLLACVQEAYGILPARLAFLPFGADVNTAVYRLEAQDGRPYFLKLRKGLFHEITVRLPLFLKSHGVQAIIPPLETQQGPPWADLGLYKLILYPFVEGKTGYEVALTEAQWRRFGEALRRVHTVQLPPALEQLIPGETYSESWREMVKALQAKAEQDTLTEPVAVKMALVLREKRSEIDRLVQRAAELGTALRQRSLPFVLCHADIHPGNLLIQPEGPVYIVDWDNPILAPKEKDLMFFGGDGAWFWRSAREEALLYHGYGQAQVDRMALAYYRYERIVEDIAAFGQELLLSDKGGSDREQSFNYFHSYFLAGGDLEVAFKTDAS